MISIGEHLTILQSVDSTNNYAMARLRAGLAKHGDSFFAMEQVSGKGRRQKIWTTEPGANIIITVVLRPPGLQLQQQFLLSAAVALAAWDFFEWYAGDETKIKWPNDIYWRDRKAGGILIENMVTTRWQWAVAGMGININQTVFPENLANPVSLKQITGREWMVVDLAKELCGHLQKRYQQLINNNNDLLDAYNLSLYKRNETVRLKKENRVFDAAVNYVDASGRLVVTTATEEQFNFGEVEWILR